MQFHTRRHRGFDHAASLAIGTVLKDRIAQAFLRPLPGHLHQTESGNWKDVGFGFVALQPFAH